MNKTSKKGFTLIELLIVIVIIGILASIVLLGVGRVQPAARDARRVAELRQIQHALEVYNRQCGFYPGAADMMSVCGDGVYDSMLDPNDDIVNTMAPWTNLTNSLTQNGQLGFHIIPNDPTPGVNYLYEANGNGSAYLLGAYLEEYAPPSPLYTSSIGGQGTGVTPFLIISCGGTVVRPMGAPAGLGVYCIQF